MVFSTRFRPHHAGAVFLLAAALVSPTSQAGLFDDLFGNKDTAKLEQWANDPSRVMKWGDWDSLRVDTRGGAGTPNAHPVELTADQVAVALASIQVETFKAIKPLFSEDEIRRFAPAIAIGLAKTTADQDLVFVSTGQHAWTGFLAPTLGTAGRVFYADGRLNLILGMVQQDFLSDLRSGSRQPPKFDFGSRGTKSRGVNIVGVSKGEAKILREDWIAITVANPGVSPVAQPGQKAVPGAAVTGGNTAQPASDPASDAFYRKQESRLRSLQRMKDQGLINDSEFQQKRAEILKDL